MVEGKFGASILVIIKRQITNGGGEIWRQHPCGIGVPAVGMAFPGYVAQPQLGLGNSEMTFIIIIRDVIMEFKGCTNEQKNTVPNSWTSYKHPCGIGVPAVGMVFPGYVNQPQLGLGNSEMTWLAVLAGVAGALGATYYPPYTVVDDAYHPCLSR
ncbi:hypothetical protein Pint_30394 [Pistacia integerrima]|uniref:Uncharacterized protein n=1 Tax=Pistacia integerrima TaxID=434235 RepID=A0ACC0WXD2_9ROSI|nr:hypothetical protein Pint_30394 [Pistacia integerrima]